MLSHHLTAESPDSERHSSGGEPEPKRHLSIEQETLAGTLHRLRVAAIIAEAEVVRDWAHSAERSYEAAKLIRQAMYLQMIGELSQAEESAVFSILAFAMPTNFDAGR